MKVPYIRSLLYLSSKLSSAASVAAISSGVVTPSPATSHTNPRLQTTISVSHLNPHKTRPIPRGVISTHGARPPDYLKTLITRQLPIANGSGDQCRGIIASIELGTQR